MSYLGSGSNVNVLLLGVTMVYDTPIDEQFHFIKRTKYKYTCEVT